MDYRQLYREGKFTEALAALEQAPEAAQKSYEYFFNRGIIHHALNQDALAVAHLEKARILNPNTDEWRAPLAESTANLAKFLGASKLDATSMGVESVGEALPLDVAFVGFSAFSVLFWLGFLLFRGKRKVLLRIAAGFLGLALVFGVWSIWLDRHPLWIATESRLSKSGPGESYLDRDPIEAGMKLRVEGKADGWLRVRMNEDRESGYVPEASGLLLVDESNTPET